MRPLDSTTGADPTRRCAERRSAGEGPRRGVVRCGTVRARAHIAGTGQPQLAACITPPSMAARGFRKRKPWQGHLAVCLPRPPALNPSNAPAARAKMYKCTKNYNF